MVTPGGFVVPAPYGAAAGGDNSTLSGAGPNVGSGPEVGAGPSVGSGPEVGSGPNVGAGPEGGADAGARAPY
jgi:hypothetical protein